MATYWEIAAHSAYDMFSLYKYLIVNSGFPTSVFIVMLYLNVKHNVSVLVFSKRLEYTLCLFNYLCSFNQANVANFKVMTPK